MTMSLTSPLTGTLQTGITGPATFTLVAGTAPDQNGRQYAVTALASGSAAGVDYNSASKPFTVTAWWPKMIKVLSYITGSGRPVQVPMNVYKWVTRKGVLVHADLPPVVMVITTTAEVPAGADTVDSANVRGAYCVHGGAIAQSASATGDTLVTATP